MDALVWDNRLRGLPLGAAYAADPQLLWTASADVTADLGLDPGCWRVDAAFARLPGGTDCLIGAFVARLDGAPPFACARLPLPLATAREAANALGDWPPSALRLLREAFDAEAAAYRFRVALPEWADAFLRRVAEGDPPRPLPVPAADTQIVLASREVP